MRMRRSSAGNATSRDQNFFLYPIHGDLLRTANIRIHYKSKLPLGLTSVFDGMTFGRHVYVTEPALFFGLKLNDAFKNQVHLLIHELAHCKQYQDLDWSIARFGCKYAWGLCKAGFSYEKNPMEREAFALEEQISDLLYTHSGRRFFKIWRDKDLFAALGYPIAKTYTALDGGMTGLEELEFEKGVLQISARGCYRYGRRATIDGKYFTCAASHSGAC